MLLRGAVQILTGGVRKCRSVHIVLHRLVNIHERSGSDTPGFQGTIGTTSFFSVHTHTLIDLFESDLGEPYKSVQELYEIAFRCRLFDMAW